MRCRAIEDDQNASPGIEVWRVLGESLVFVLDCKVEDAGFQDAGSQSR